ncbi:MAG: aminoglycoside 3'-phosphotransferase [Oscillospiraceae bacterium]|nr:aminoglycoside 3'-phosphotransferase [Oscillospiraceae bacterium]
MDDRALQLEYGALPENIARLIAGRRCEKDGVGRSGAEIFYLDDYVLKAVKYRIENEDAVRVMRWLEGRLPVPEVICFERRGDIQYLLMSRVPGRMTCDTYYTERPEKLTALLAEALNMLWSVDTAGCPRVMDADALLAEAGYRVENRLVDTDGAEASTFGKGGFAGPEALLKWLEDNRPDFEPVFSHGDLCLPNILAQEDRVSGFVDLGGAGIGDRWRDAALCRRSLAHNLDGTYGGKVCPGFDPDLLFDALGIRPDREKLRWYTLLDELF